MMKAAAFLFVGLIVAACATPYRQMYYYNEVRVNNDSSEPITDVAVRIGDAGPVLQCDRVGSKDTCYQRLRSKRYPDLPIEMSWTTAEGTRQTRQLDPEVPGYFSAPFPLRLRLKLGSDGSLGLRFWQDEPFRD